MDEGINNSFSKLTAKYNIVLDHVTEVNGFADSVRHLDAFYNIATTLNLQWILPVFKNSRSCTSGRLPYEIAGLSDFLEYNCSAPKTLLNNKNIIHINIDFNRLVSGDRDAHKGSLLINGVSQEELFLNIKRGLLEAIEIAELEHKTKRANIVELLSRLTSKKVVLPVIHFRLFINRLPIITKFSNVKKLSNALLEFNAKNSPPEDRVSSLNIVIHLRKGDITVFPLPDGGFIASWGDFRKENNRRALPERIERLSDSVYPQYDVEPYLLLIKKVVELSPGKINLSFLCDGFDRGLDRIQDNSESLELRPTELGYIRHWVSKEEIRIKKLVSDMTGNGVDSVNILWGESEALFEQSFQSIEAADILLFSSGGFAKTIFSYFNKVHDSISIGPCTKETASNHTNTITKTIKNIGDNTK